MIGEPDPDQAALLATARKFGTEVLTPELARQVDDEHRFPDEIYAQMAGLGWLGIPFPEEYGGGGGDLLTMLLLLESLSTSMFAAGNIYFRNVVNGGLNVLSSGTQEQKRLILPDLIAGRIKMCYAMTEPEAGSDVSNMRTYARREGDEYRVSGSKVFITGAAESDWMQLFCRTGDGKRDVTVLLVPTKSDGITFAVIPKLGNNGMNTYEVRLDDVRVPAQNVLGEENNAWAHVRRSLNLERVAVSVECIGGARACFDLAVRYARERVQFGRPIVEFQALQHRLVDMRLDLEASRLLTYQAAEIVQQGNRADLQAAMAKYHTGLMYFRCATDAMSVLGGYGYTKTFEAERHLRDAALYRIVPGQEVLKDTMARSILREAAG
jgi:alkylation response protein AidB-like acyl-CoA dehydrogenase